MKTFELAFSGYSVYWSEEYLNMQLLSSGTLFGTGGSRNLGFESFTRPLVASLDQFSF